MMKLNWSYVVVGLLGSFILFILVLIFTAGDTGSLITVDYYKEELKFQNEIDAQNRFNLLNEKPQLIQQANGILIQFPDALKDTVQLSLKRYESDQNDIFLKFKLRRNHTLLIPANRLKKGVYNFRMFWLQDGFEYLMKKDSINWKQP